MSETARILLVEDDEDDVFLAMEGFRRAKFLVDIERVENGIECMKYLNKQGKYQNKSLPDIVLLDLNMPLMDGRAVLKEIVSTPELSSMPVVILTTSDAERDVLDMYKLRCSSYIVKPIDFNKFKAVIEEFSEYWFSLVRRPQNIG